MNDLLHPDPDLLEAYSKKPEAEEFKQVSLHLLRCRECREQLDMTHRLRSGFSSLQFDVVKDEQQVVVDDFLYGEKTLEQQQRQKQAIRDDPRLLKSALFTLANKFDEQPRDNASQDEGVREEYASWLARLSNWFHWQTTAWATVAVTAVVTLTLTVLILQPNYFAPNKGNDISVAGYQDDPVMRFSPANQLPGIGFFSGAVQSTQSYQGMQINSNEQQMLELRWRPVEDAISYEISLYRFAKGEKTLLETLKTQKTSMQYPLTSEDLNNRFEWVLSGLTRKDERFITSGGFVVSKSLNQGKP